MKIAFVTTNEILGPQNAGDVHCSNRNLNLLKQAFGEENIFVCAITRNKEYLSKKAKNVVGCLSGRSRKPYSMKNGIAALCGRESFDKKAETAILKSIIKFCCDAVFFDDSLMGNLPNLLPKEMKQILFAHNVEIDNVKRRPRKRLLNLLLLLPTKISESKTIEKADFIISLNNRDATLLKKHYGRDVDLILPITFDDYFVEPIECQILATEEKYDQSPLKLLFLSTLFMATEHGISWFVSNIMPHVNAELIIVGRDFERLSNKLERENVKVIGTVNEVPPYYFSVDAVVSPIFSGGGMKVKTAEALMYGKTMFATDEALEGYEVEGLENIYRCNSALEFIASINNYANKKPYIRFDSNIRSRFLEKYHTPKYVPIIKEMVREFSTPSNS